MRGGAVIMNLGRVGRRAAAFGLESLPFSADPSRSSRPPEQAFRQLFRQIPTTERGIL